MCNYSDLVSLFSSSGNFDNDGFKKAIEAGCQDMTVRTMKKKVSATITRVELRDYLCDNKNYPGGNSLLTLLTNYFNGPAKDEADYDTWHDKACQAVLSCLNVFYLPESVTYGKAQKVVNIAIKNIFCLNGAQIYYNNHYFDHCHMALDSFTLEWVYRKTKGTVYNNEKITRDNFVSWSNITNKQNKNANRKTVLSYQDIQNLIRTIDTNGLTPFEAEFYVWRQMLQTIAAEALFDSDLGGMKRDQFKKMPLNYKIGTLTNLLQKVNYSYYLI